MANPERLTDPRRAARPEVVDRSTFQTELDRLQAREKAHTREGDAIAAARRRLPMVEVDAQIPVTGADGDVPLLEVFEGRSQLVAYYHMWHTGRRAAEQCEGCTFNTAHVTELNYLHSRDVSYAVFCQGPYEEAARYRTFMGYPAPWYSLPPASAGELVPYFGILASYLRDGHRVFQTWWTTGRGDEVMAPSYALLDRTVYGRQEQWEDSPQGWPQGWPVGGGQFRAGGNGRPIAQLSRIASGRDDDLGPTPPGWAICTCALHADRSDPTNRPSPG
jgi:predicted dithiol-disulfide oxidoreductase (DUF899 family)